MLSVLKVKRFQSNFALFFASFFQPWKWNAFSLILPYFSCIFFTNSENETKSKFRQEMLNIFIMLKFAGSHLAFYEWKVSFSLISPIFFFTRVNNIRGHKLRNSKEDKTFPYLIRTLSSANPKALPSSAMDTVDPPLPHLAEGRAKWWNWKFKIILFNTSWSYPALPEKTKCFHHSC